MFSAEKAFIAIRTSIARLASCHLLILFNDSPLINGKKGDFSVKIASALISNEARTRGRQCYTLKTDAIQFPESAPAQGEESVLFLSVGNIILGNTVYLQSSF